MTSHRLSRVTRRFGRLAALSGFSLSAIVLTVSPPVVSTLGATAHIGLASSVPAKDAHLMTAPSEIRLTFTGPIDVAKAGVELVTSDAKAVALDSLRAVTDSPRVAVARITGTMAGGNYTVKWNAVARDGAKGTGSFGFMYMKRND